MSYIRCWREPRGNRERSDGYGVALSDQNLYDRPVVIALPKTLFTQKDTGRAQQLRNQCCRWE